MRLSLNDISVSFGENEVLKNICFDVNTKDKIALVGRNGSGKTTLLKVITGEQEIDATSGGDTNKIQKTGKFDIGYLKQIAFEDDNELFENEILKVYSEIINLKKKIDQLESDLESGKETVKIEKYEELLHKFDILGGYVYQKEYNTAIKKFGFTEEDKKKPLKEFSGGQRTKIALIKLLLGRPDLLILDEPTNHLDLNSIEWLEDYLQNYNKAIVVVSHDRAFLDKFVNVVYEIERGKIKKYSGNYTAFAKTKELNYEKDLKEYEAQKKEKERLLAVADRFRYKATKASMAQSKLKQIEKMGEIVKPEMADTKVFSTNSKPRVESGNDVLFAQDIEIGYDKVLSKISFRIFKGDKIAIVGGNGLGKSTLLKSIVGKIPLIRGKFKFGTNVEIGPKTSTTSTFIPPIAQISTRRYGIVLYHSAALAASTPSTPPDKPRKRYKPSESNAAGKTISKFVRNLSFILHPCVIVAAMVVSEINERLSPKNAPPTTIATICAVSTPICAAKPVTTGVRATIVPTEVPIESDTKQAAIKIPAGKNSIGTKRIVKCTVASTAPIAFAVDANIPARMNIQII